MRAVVQRVRSARVLVGGEIVGAVERGLCALVGVAEDDEEADAAKLARRIAALRVFCAALAAEGVQVATGVFGARMLVELENDGPVTIVLETEGTIPGRRRP